MVLAGVLLDLDAVQVELLPIPAADNVQARPPMRDVINSRDGLAECCSRCQSPCGRLARAGGRPVRSAETGRLRGRAAHVAGLRARTCLLRRGRAVADAARWVAARSRTEVIGASMPALRSINLEHAQLACAADSETILIASSNLPSPASKPLRISGQVRPRSVTGRPWLGATRRTPSRCICHSMRST
jgi:hypothetical protein